MDDLRIKTCVIGMVNTNCYLVYHDQTKDAVIVDPADNSEYLIRQCKALGISPKAILLTHGHFDHILAAKEIKAVFDCPIYAGREEDLLLRDPAMNLSGSYGTPRITITADYLASDGEILRLIGFEWQVITTPGHTGGSTCFLIGSEGVLFAGDTLFLESVGRSDLPTGDSFTLVNSVLTKLFVLPEETMVYPGHGDPTSIAHEKQYNPVAGYGNQ